MALPVYPTLPGLALPVKWTPRFFNMASQTTASGADIDLALAAYPLHDFELQYDFLRDGLGLLEFKTLFGFMLQLAGTPGRFLFSNPDDNIVVGQSIGTGDGSTTTFTLVRTFGAGGFGGTEPVGMADLTATFNVKVNGVTKTLGTDYTVDQTTACANTVTFTAAPAAAATITVDMSYRYYCKFPDNAQEFDKFMSGLWSLQKVVLHSCRPSLPQIAAGTFIVGNNAAQTTSSAVAGDFQQGVIAQASTSGIANNIVLVGNAPIVSVNYRLTVYAAASSTVISGILLGRSNDQVGVAAGLNTFALQSPVSITAGNWYAIMLHAGGGTWSPTASNGTLSDRDFADTYSDGPLATALASTLNSPNGRMIYLTS